VKYVSKFRNTSTECVLAAYMHDMGYAIGATDNKHKACRAFLEFAAHTWEVLGLNIDITKVLSLIMATGSPFEHKDSDFCTRILIEADFAVLRAEERDELNLYEDSVRQEYMSQHTKKEYYVERKSFLKKVLLHFGTNRQIKSNTTYLLEKLERDLAPKEIVISDLIDAIENNATYFDYSDGGYGTRCVDCKANLDRNEAHHDECFVVMARTLRTKLDD
jgi:predicted metal-dependent HD superfamily phosphohydrolase